MAKKLAPMLDLGAGDGTVGVHFRRGDYLMHGYSLPLSFQEEALAEIAKQCRLSKVLVFSDDRDFAVLAVEHFDRLGYPTDAASPDPGRSELEDFCALATAQHLVMSNSTYAWWAAVLGDHLRGTGRVVVCPTPWMPLSAGATIPSARLDLSRTGWLLRSWERS
jgi:hypothetical protein